MGTGRGNTGVQQRGPRLLEEGPMTAKRAPEAPSRGWSGWSWEPDVLGPAAGVGTHPPGPVRTPAGSLPGSSANAASWPITARFDLLFCKVSQNTEVSPKSVDKACHSP